MARKSRRKWAPVFDVVGESHHNRNGTSRQDILAKCNPGDPVRLLHEANNPADPNAVAVNTAYGMVGYLKREDAAEVAPLLDAGLAPDCCIYELRGGIPDYPSYGVQISVPLGGEPHIEPVPLRPDQVEARANRAAPTWHADDSGGENHKPHNLPMLITGACASITILWIVFG